MWFRDGGKIVMQLYTIGFVKKDAQTFFGLLKENQIRLLMDVRLNNVSQLASYTKKNDLIYFLKQIGDIAYYHALILAPTKELLEHYKKNEMSWLEYEKEYNALIRKRHVKEVLKEKLQNNFDKVCLLCSELEPTKCHRRLAAEYIKEYMGDIEIIHL